MSDRLFALPLMLAAFVGFAATATAGPPESVPQSQIPVYKLVTPGLATGGQPTPEGLARLKEMGFKTVVNLRTEKEGPLEERSVVEGQGLRYVHVPVTPETLSMADADAVQKVLDDPAAGPVLLHCASSNRVGALYAVIQSRKGLTPEQALDAGRNAGLQSPVMAAAVLRVLGLPGGPVASPAAPPAASVPAVKP
jgi:uncharacterized protein (TIGR01244 family)